MYYLNHVFHKVIFLGKTSFSLLLYFITVFYCKIMFKIQILLYFSYDLNYFET